MEVEADIPNAEEEVMAGANEMVDVQMQFTVSLTRSNIDNTSHGVVSFNSCSTNLTFISPEYYKFSRFYSLILTI